METTKICSKCGNEKPLNEFYKQELGVFGVRADCKLCYRVIFNKWKINNLNYIQKYSIEYYKKNKENRKNKAKEYYRKNREVQLAYGKRYYQKNKEKTSKYNKVYNIINKEKRSKARKEYYQNNKERNKQLCKNWYKKNLVNAAHKWMRNFLYRTEKMGFNGSKSNTITEFGYEPNKLIQRIECQFKDGMSWKNRSLWHIDHIKPMNSFKEGTSPRTINMLSNLRPLWKEENISKGCSFTTY